MKVGNQVQVEIPADGGPEIYVGELLGLRPRSNRAYVVAHTLDGTKLETPMNISTTIESVSLLESQ
jgi:hypothetical protein